MIALKAGGHYFVRMLALILVGLCFTTICATAEPTTDVHIQKIAPDGITILNETAVSYQWMEEHLPVQGDGITHYYHQGPVFAEEKEAQWDPGETTNFKDWGAVKGTAIRDLCDLVGGMSPGDHVMIKAGDGYHVEFRYENVYEPHPRQGEIVLCWHNGEDSQVGERQGTGYPPDYHAGMRLVFFADNSTNPEGKHVFGNWDMHEVMPEEDIHLFSDLYPSTSGYGVKWVDEIRIYEGGYHGEKGALAKSAMDLPSTEGASIPLSILPVFGGILVVLALRGRP